jgi:hypothetical protein
MGPLPAFSPEFLSAQPDVFLHPCNALRATKGSFVPTRVTRRMFIKDNTSTSLHLSFLRLLTLYTDKHLKSTQKWNCFLSGSS